MEVLLNPEFFEINEEMYKKCKDEQWKSEVIDNLLEKTLLKEWSKTEIDSLLHIHEFGMNHNNEDQKSKVKLLTAKLIEHYNQE